MTTEMEEHKEFLHKQLRLLHTEIRVSQYNDLRYFAFESAKRIIDSLWDLEIIEN